MNVRAIFENIGLFWNKFSAAEFVKKFSYKWCFSI